MGRNTCRNFYFGCSYGDFRGNVHFDCCVWICLFSDVVRKENLISIMSNAGRSCCDNCWDGVLVGKRKVLFWSDDLEHFSRKTFKSS
ncbi:hypothetical protein CEXT_717101 [Caerostris extrusa]|uniref:Uncharacterized protein n=1 Tax=Caerostris extrusa TaxID=172846 RepID=A0AAV4WNQ2_CAEEX|nr:hypothetical protein CEXT_717101 [Caerostris extrusa]